MNWSPQKTLRSQLERRRRGKECNQVEKVLKRPRKAMLISTQKGIYRGWKEEGFYQLEELRDFLAVSGII